MNTFVEEFGNSLDNIKMSYNFMSQEDLKSVKQFLDEASNTISEDMHLKEVVHFPVPDAIRQIIQKYDRLVIEKAEELYGRKFIDGQNIFRCTIHKIGSWSHPHTDILEVGMEPQKPDSPEFIGWRDAWDGYLACNIYINDNYEGGEVYFPERDYSFKPVENQLVMWAGNKYFIHGVKDPLTANRYTLTRWIKFADFDKYNV